MKDFIEDADSGVNKRQKLSSSEYKKIADQAVKDEFSSGQEEIYKDPNQMETLQADIQKKKQESSESDDGSDDDGSSDDDNFWKIRLTFA